MHKQFNRNRHAIRLKLLSSMMIWYLFNASNLINASSYKRVFLNVPSSTNSRLYDITKKKIQIQNIIPICFIIIYVFFILLIRKSLSQWPIILRFLSEEMTFSLEIRLSTTNYVTFCRCQSKLRTFLTNCGLTLVDSQSCEYSWNSCIIKL